MSDTPTMPTADERRDGIIALWCEMLPIPEAVKADRELARALHGDGAAALVERAYLAGIQIGAERLYDLGLRAPRDNFSPRGMAATGLLPDALSPEQDALRRAGGVTA